MQPIDITPIRATTDPMGNNPFQTTGAGSTLIRVTDVGNGSVVGDWKGDAGRWENGYWGRWQGAWAYTQGDFAIAHPDGSFSFHGRSDDVINVSGHRMGTEEIEGAVLRDKALDPNSPVGNVLVVGAPHREKGLTPLAFVVGKSDTWEKLLSSPLEPVVKAGALDLAPAPEQAAERKMQLNGLRIDPRHVFRGFAFFPDAQKGPGHHADTSP